MKFNALIPELTVFDLARSLRFYVETLGFKIEYRREAQGFVFLSFQGSQLMLEQRNGAWETGALEAPLGRGINFQIDAERIEPLVVALRAAGAVLFREPFESWYRVGDHEHGQREFLVQDPDGYLLRFNEELGTRPLTGAPSLSG